MSSGRKTLFLSLTGFAAASLVGAAAIAATDQSEIPAPALMRAEAPLVGDDAMNTAQPMAVPAVVENAAPVAATVDMTDPQLICMAKVVRHEAANQSREGQLAVAQLIMNRLHNPRFPKTVCGVVNQTGQFFDTASYNPSREDRLWRAAMDVAIDAYTDDSESVIGEAVFYNAAGSTSSFHSGRRLAATIGAHRFYY